jgi:asparagine synthase (glutamine-hydrolysing)
LIRSIKQNNLTYLSYDRLFNIGRIVLRTERDRVQGEFVEAGCGLGGSSILIARAKRPDRRLTIYDVFGTIPPPSELDGDDAHARYDTIAAGKSVGIGGDEYYGYVGNLLDQIKTNFTKYGVEPGAHGVQFSKGLYQDTMTSTAPVAFAHIDCDWYDSVHTCLKNVVPRLVPGGSIIVDDYLDWSGCRKAVDEYFGPEIKPKFEFRLSSNLHIRKISN